MAEVTAIPAGGGTKVYTEADCYQAFNVNVIDLPPGVTWGQIKNLVGTVAQSGNTTVIPILKELNGTRLGSCDYYNQFFGWNTPDPSAIQITLVGTGSLYLRRVIIVV